MTATYDSIATTTLGSAASSITFSSITGTYTDLRIVIVGTAVDTGAVRMRLNGDSGSNYSQTYLYGDGASAASARATSNSNIQFSVFGTGLSTTLPHMATVDLFSYAGSTNKTQLIEFSHDKNGSGSTERIVSLWRSTSAITQIQIYNSGGNFAAGYTATLYGIKAE